MKYQPVIGLEIHIELATKTKMFCDCANNPNERTPNVNVCPICMGHPGTLPVINKEAVRKVIKTGLALNCKIPEYSKFDRKNYFYPDLPKGYQISQYDKPFCINGFLKVEDRKVRITRVHLEEDTGSLVHPKGADYSLVNFNRAGIPLMELVTEPDISSSPEARQFAQELQLILRYLAVSEANMEKGEMRVEANVSLKAASDKTRGTDKLGTKVEIKNLNSFKSVEKAIDYEIKRQTDILEQGKKVSQETRGWDEVKEITVSQRSKEEAHDYRYFPEPDLPPLKFSKRDVAEIKVEIPELPQNKRKRLALEYKLDQGAVEFFVQNKDLGEYLEKVVSEFEPNLPQKKLSYLITLATNYIITDLQGLIKEAGVTGEDFLVTPENFAELISLLESGKILSKVAKAVLSEMFKTGADPSHIIEEKSLTQISGKDEIKSVVRQVISENEKAASDYKKGRKSSLQFLIGQVMAKTKGRVDPKSAQEILKKELKS